MEVVAPGDVTAAPFALCPRFQMLAVGMAPTRAAPGEETTGASRVDVLRLLRPSGEPDLGSTLQVDSVLRAPGLRRLAWASTPTQEGESGLTPVEELLYPTGLLAGGFEDGTVRIWNTPISDISKSHVPVKTKAERLYLMDIDPELAAKEEAQMLMGISAMHSEIPKIVWNYSDDTKYFQIEEAENLEKRLPDDAYLAEWDLIGKEEPKVTHERPRQMELVAEAHDLNGPVLGLSFNTFYPQLIATAARGKSICIHDLQYPINLSKKKRVMGDSGSYLNNQITCLKWSRIYPSVLATSGDAGYIKIWDLRKSEPVTTFLVRSPGSSDLEFSWNNPMHLAVSTINSGKGAAVKILDMRSLMKPVVEYDIDPSGTISLSWNRSGHLLASHQNGSLSCYDVYQQKMLQVMDSAHCDLGSTWTHMDNVAALFSSKTGVKLYEIGV